MFPTFRPLPLPPGRPLTGYRPKATLPSILNNIYTLFSAGGRAPSRGAILEDQVARLLENKIAIVTGAGHGIGRGHALELARYGAKVVVNDLGTSVDGEGSGKDADEVVALISERGGVAVADYGDVADDDQGPALIDRAVSEFGRLDILVNNAGIARDKVIWNMSPADFDLVIRVHVRGTWLLMHHA